jgi:hypothetical protein
MYKLVRALACSTLPPVFADTWMTKLAAVFRTLPIVALFVSNLNILQAKTPQVSLQANAAKVAFVKVNDLAGKLSGGHQTKLGAIKETSRRYSEVC